MLTDKRRLQRRLAIAALIGVSGCTSAVERTGHDSWASLYSQAPDTMTEAETAAAESLATAPRTLAQALDYAERHNAGLRAAFERWTAAREGIAPARSLPDPRFSYAYFIEPIETRVGPQRQKFGFTQTIPLFGKLGGRGDVAIHAANVAGADFERERLALRLRVTTLWNDYYYLGRAIATTEENVRLVTHLENAALSQYAAGGTSHAAAIRAQVELGKLEDRLRTLLDHRRALAAGLNAELDRTASDPIPWPDSIDASHLELSQEELQQLLLHGNPSLVGLRSRAAQDSAAASLASKNAIPDLTLGAEYIETGPAVNPDAPESGKDAAVAMASINVPLWFGHYRSESAQANARRASTLYELRQRQNKLVAELEQAHFEYRDADRRVELYAFTLLPKARQAFEVTEDAFSTGESSFLDLIDAQRPLLEFELAYERALADRSTRLAQLETLVGGSLRGESPKGNTP